MADMIKFFKGQLANLPEVGTNGALYITTDEGSIYLGTGTGMKRLGDFVQVANVASLPTGGANESALYYCVAENILCKWNGSSWSQINKDTGMTSVEVVGEGNAVTAAEYNAETRKLTMTKGATYATPAVVDSKIATAVGELGADEEGNAYANVKAYVDAKTTGIATDAALGELQQRVTTAEGEIDAIQAALGTEGDTTKAIGAAQAAADKAQGEVDALEEEFGNYKTTNDAAVKAAKDQADKGVADAEAAKDRADEAYELADGKATMDEVNNAIANAGHAVKSEVDQAIADMDAAYKKADADLKTELQGKIDLKADKSVVNAIAEDYLKGADKIELEGKITAEAEARAAADEAIDARLVEVEAFFKLADGEQLDTALDTLVEIQNYITTEGSAADQMVLDIAANKAAHEKNAEDIAKEIKDREDADKALSDRIDGIHTHDNKSVLDGITETKVAAWDAAQVNVIETIKVNGEALEVTGKAVDIAVPTGALAAKDEVAKTDLAKALADEIDAKAVAADVETELGKKVDKVDGKSLIADTEIARLAAMSDGANKVEASTTNGNIKIDGTETVVYTHPATHAISEVAGLQDALDLKLEAEDIAGKANSADVYTKAETYTKDEVNALLTWGEF
jgi:hypothetical protein